MPQANLKRLYDVVIQSLTEVVGSERLAASVRGQFVAHTSFAYTKSQNNEAAVLDSLHAADIQPGTFRVTHMPLIKQRPTGGHYEWDIVKDIVI